MSFEEISLVIPCIEYAHSYGYTDLYKDQGYFPRVFKTHLFYRDCPKGAGKYIIVVRNPVDAALSFYHMLNGWVFPEGSVTPRQLLESCYLGRDIPPSHHEEASIWRHILSWYPYRKDPNVLYLHYEDMKADLAYVVDLMATFLGIGADDEELKALVTRQASFEFMKAHHSKFDEHPLKHARNEANGLPRDAGLTYNTGKVRKGNVGSGREELPADLVAELLDRWKTEIGSKLGF